MYTFSLLLIILFSHSLPHPRLKCRIRSRSYSVVLTPILGHKEPRPCIRVLITSCKVMAPFTPFFTEVLYQNMRKVCNGSEESIHYCSFPVAEGKVIREFRRPDNMTENEIDAAGDGDVLVILDLRPDASLFEAGVAREIVNRIQKLRKKAALEPTDMVEVYYNSLDEDRSISQKVLNSQELYIKDVLGSPLLSANMIPSHSEMKNMLKLCRYI